MRFFARPAYTSDASTLLNRLKAAKPTLEEEQRQARNLWWDRPLDRQAQAEFQASRVPQKPYVYLSASPK